MNKGGKIWVVVIIVMLVLIIVLGSAVFFLYRAVTDTANADKIKTQESYSITEPLVRSVVLGEEQTITDDNINGVLASVINSYIEAEGQSENKSDFTVKGASVYLQDDNKADIYIDLYYKDIRMIFSANAKVTFNEQSEFIAFDIESTHLGALPLPSEYIVPKLSDALKAVNESFKVQGNRIIIPSEYTVEVLGKGLDIKIIKLSVSKGEATVQTTSAMEMIEGLLKDFLGDLF